MKNQITDLIFTIFWVLLTVLVVLLQLGNEYFRGSLVLPLVLFFPGYALTNALFSKQTLGSVERITLILGSSMAITILCGLILNWMPGGLQRGSWVALLGGFILVFSAWGASRHRVEGTPRKVSLELRSILQAALLGVAFTLTIGAYLIARQGAIYQPRPGFTQLWLLPEGEPPINSIRVGVQSHETETARYSLRVQQDQTLLGEWPSIELQPGGKWESDLNIAEAQGAGSGKIEAILFRQEAPGEPYRRAWLSSGSP